MTMYAFTLLCTFGFAAASGITEKFVIDTDTGADDAVAIFTILQTEKYEQTVELIGVTTVHGNTNVDNVARNVLKTLDTANRLDIPVFKGANQSIILTPPGDNFFGEDGFGDFEYPNPPSEDYIQDKHAVNYLVDIVRAHPGEVNLLAIGPLTNIAMAARMDPKFLPGLKSLHVLGGTAQGMGNARPNVEFNFYCDPEAVYIVMEEMKNNGRILELLPWETAFNAGPSKEWRKNVFGVIDSPLVQLLNKAENVSSDSEDKWISADTFATLWAIDPNFPAETTDVSAVTETCGNVAKGAIFFDYMERTGEFQQVRVANPKSLNVSYIEEKLVEIFSMRDRFYNKT